MHPSDSSGSQRDPSQRGVVVVMGDSNIREDRVEIEASLTEIGFDVVFICWGGKQLPWGEQQVSAMKALGITPRCLVANLGTNDLKGTTANGLADAVPPSEVQTRLLSLLRAASDIPNVVVVDVAAAVSRAPSTMKRVDELVDVYANSTSGFANVTLAQWSAYTNNNPGVIGSDGIHDSAMGAAARAAVIASAVASACR
jgi:hypothetical protein